MNRPEHGNSQRPRPAGGFAQPSRHGEREQLFREEEKRHGRPRVNENARQMPATRIVEAKELVVGDKAQALHRPVEI